MKYLLYAEGGEGIGSGHLRRIANLIRTLKLSENYICLFENKTQYSFYTQENIKCSSLDKIKDEFFFEYFIIDSKKPREDLLKLLRECFNKLILIDNNSKISNDASLLITPSYYSSNLNFIKKESLECSGYKYIILNPIINNFIWTPKKYKLISFGGEDPNNLTLAVLKKLKRTGKIRNTKVIIGPYYHHKISKIFDYLDEEDVIINPKNIYELFSKSKYVITAVGVTLQELFKIGVPSVVIANYKHDISEFKIIKDFASQYMGEKFVNIIGYYKDIDDTKFIKMNEHASSYVPNINVESSDIGSGIKDLNNLLDSNLN